MLWAVYAGWIRLQRRETRNGWAHGEANGRSDPEEVTRTEDA